MPSRHDRLDLQGGSGRAAAPRRPLLPSEGPRCSAAHQACRATTTISLDDGRRHHLPGARLCQGDLPPAPNFVGVKHTGMYTYPGMVDAQRIMGYNGGKFEVLSG